MSSNLALKAGSEVDYGERRFTIMQVISFETVVAQDVETGDLERLPIAGLRAIEPADPPVPARDLAELDDRDWAEARRRLDLIKPLLERARLPRSVMAQRAAAAQPAAIVAGPSGPLRGKALFAQNCAACHGVDAGRGARKRARAQESRAECRNGSSIPPRRRPNFPQHFDAC